MARNICSIPGNLCRPQLYMEGFLGKGMFQGGFTPRNLSSLSHWYDNSDDSAIVLNGSNVKGQRDKAFDFLNNYTSNFGTIDGWIASNMNLTANQAIGGQSAALLSTKDATAGSATFSKNVSGVHVVGKYTEYNLSVYLPSGNSEIDGYQVFDESGSLLIIDKRSTSPTPPLTNQWETISISQVVGSTDNNFVIQCYNGNNSALTAASDGDQIYIRGVAINRDGGSTRYALNASEQPAYSNPTITADGVGNFFDMSNSVTETEGCLVSVVRFIGSFSELLITAFVDANNNMLIGQNATQDDALYYTELLAVVDSLTEGTDLGEIFTICEFATDGTTKYVAINGGIFVTSVNVPAWFGDYPSIIPRWFRAGSTGLYYNVEEKESVMLNSFPSEEERNELISYLNEKYSVF